VRAHRGRQVVVLVAGAVDRDALGGAASDVVDEIISRAAEDVSNQFLELRISDVRVGEGSILVTIVIGTAIIQIGAGETVAAGVGIWAIIKVGGSALEQFGKRIGDLAYEALPERLRGKRRMSKTERSLS